MKKIAVAFVAAISLGSITSAMAERPTLGADRQPAGVHRAQAGQRQACNDLFADLSPQGCGWSWNESDAGQRPAWRGLN